VPSDYLGPWLKTMDPAREEAAADVGSSETATLAPHLELVSIKHSLERLKQFGFVQSAIEERGLELHGARFSIHDGVLEWLGSDGQFAPV
jgi:carbonic anhydrase